MTDRLGWFIKVDPMAGIFDSDDIFAFLLLWEHLLVNWKIVLSWFATDDIQSVAFISQWFVKVRYVLELVFESWKVDGEFYWVIRAIFFVLHETTYH